MATATTNLYEVMFLIGQGTAARLAEVLDHINTIFERSNLEVLAMQKWDERRLAFEIDKQKRAVYILAYVNGDPQKIAGFERDCNLAEDILRILLLRADHMTEDEAKAFDRREELMTEAKMRAQTARDEEERSASGATLGAPPSDEPEPVEVAADAETAADDEDE